MDSKLGVDVGGSAIKWVVLDQDDTPVDQGSIPTPNSPSEVVEVIAALAVGVDRIGIAMPGHVDRAAGCVLFVPVLLGDWNGFGLVETVRDRTGVHDVVLVNDARAFGLAELRVGACRGLDDALFVVLGTGVGGAIAHRGHIMVGARDNVGDIGHLTVDPAGPPCRCGNRGCVEAYVGSRALLAAHAESGDTVDSVPALAAAASAGNASAAHVFRTAGQALGRGLGDALAVFGQRTVVIGGGVAPALPLMLSEILNEIARRHALLGPCTVTAARLGPHAGAVGAALWTLEGEIS